MSFAAAHFGMLARYNAWANERLYAACARLPAAEYLKPRPAFFRSLHGTLNHVLVGDRVWLARFEGRDAGLRALDQILYQDFSALREPHDQLSQTSVAPPELDLIYFLREKGSP